jgi:hypothetical protein
MLFRGKNTYIIVFLIILACVISGAISFMLLKNIIAHQALPKKPVAARSDASTPAPAALDVTLPAENASPEEIDTFYVATLRKATKANEITISNCTPEPKFIKVAPNTKITLKNTDTKMRVITVKKKLTYPVPAQGEATLVANFGNDIGTYGYSCGQSSQLAGIIVITNEEREAKR